MSQCSKEDGRSSSGPPHEAAAPKRTYDMMEGRVGRAISSASIEGGRPAHLPPPVDTAMRGGLGSAPGASQLTAVPAVKRGLSPRPLEGGGGTVGPVSQRGELRLSPEAAQGPGKGTLACQVLCRHQRHHGDSRQCPNVPTT